MRGLGRWLVLVAVLAVCVGAAFAAKQMASIAWDAVVEYASPYKSEPLDPTVAAPVARSQATSRTVYVIVDGLGLDVSRTMPALNALRSYGADLELTAPQPSLSNPNWTTLLTGAPPYVSGVVTNWHEGAAGVETLFDTAQHEGKQTVFVGPSDFESLYGVKSVADATYMKEWQEEYLSDEYVDQAIALAEKVDPSLLVLHLPDVDEAGHAHGGASEEYAQMALRVDGDIGRLVSALGDGSTVFVVVADHGHIATGGHGGWERDAVTVPGVFAGPGIPLTEGVGRSEQVASTVALLSGVPIPRYSLGSPLVPVSGALARTPAAVAQQRGFWRMHGRVVGSDIPTMPSDAAVSAGYYRSWDADQQVKRLARDRSARLPMALLLVAVCVAAVITVALASRPALWATLSGTAAYYAVYNGLFFLLHGNQWSLSAFNSEDKVEAWLNLRLVEAAIALLIGAAVAGLVYPLFRRVPKLASGSFLAGWLTLGPATALVVLATLGVQIAWFMWAWGTDFTWRLPNLMWGMKFDLDLVQATAVGLAAVVAPLVTFLIGRYHPRMRKSA